MDDTAGAAHASILLLLLTLLYATACNRPPAPGLPRPHHAATSVGNADVCRGYTSRRHACWAARWRSPAGRPCGHWEVAGGGPVSARALLSVPSRMMRLTSPAGEGAKGRGEKNACMGARGQEGLLWRAGRGGGACGA